MRSILSLMAAIFWLASCNGSENNFNQQSYQQHKESLAGREKNNPVSFLQITGDNKKNLIGQTVIHGKISNNATVISYRDIRIRMLCYKDDKMVEEHEDVVNDVIRPGTAINFKTRYRLPKGTDSVALSVMSASIAR